jgi:N-acetylneuraminic acid mutarotase
MCRPASRSALRSLVIPVAMLVVPACHDEPLQPSAPASPSATLAAGRNSWAIKAPMPTPRSMHTAGVANDAAGRSILYVFGGTDGLAEDAFNTVEAYDPATNTWTTQPSAVMFAKVTSPNGVGRIGNKLYLPGGLVETGDAKGAISVLQVYDPARNKWTRRADMPHGSGGGVSGVIDGKLYVLSGVEACLDCSS